MVTIVQYRYLKLVENISVVMSYSLFPLKTKGETEVWSEFVTVSLYTAAVPSETCTTYTSNSYIINYDGYSNIFVVSLSFFL